MALANIAAQRVRRELREILHDSDVARCGVKVTTNSDQNLLELRGEISGPPNTPYEGGNFVLDILIPENYPFTPPKIKFFTKIWHPNISSVTGAVCVDILKDQWAAAMTLRTVLLSLQSLLSAPEPDDPQDAVVATQYKESYSTFVNTAKHWTAVYGGGPCLRTEWEELVSKLQDLGVSETAARARLSQTNWDFQKALDLSLSR